MPAEALPVQPGAPENAPVRVRFQQTYRDALDRPMAGKVRLTATGMVTEGSVVIPPAPVDVDLVGGVLDVHLPAGIYQLSAQLTTADGVAVVDKRTVTLVRSR